METIEKKSAVETYIQQRKSGQDLEPICAYVYDLERLKQHAESIKKSLPSFCRFYYAVKANPAEELLNTLDPIVDGFEVASIGEIGKVSNVSDKPMLFGGPGKKDSEIEKALDHNVDYLNVESFHELNRMNYIAEQNELILPVLLRVNLSENVSESNIRMSGVPSQFGVDERDLPELIEKAMELEHIDVKGFHFHAMSNNLDAQAHVRFVEMCIEKSLAWRDEYELNTPIIDIGGGVGINYWNPDEPFDWDMLANGLAACETTYKDENLTLFLEIGRYLTAECGSYVAEVLDVKTNHSEHFAIIRGGSHHLRFPAAWKISQPFRIHPIEEWDYPFERPEILHAAVTVAGELCTPNDVLVRKEFMKQLRAGDVLIFEYAGAYGWTISHHDFLSHPHPEHVYI
ncbi:type III PLP-dependent enzyme [Pseudalkalibacillus hwajinpoensis]|uniref:Type III PLP-dependent enzyme n=1 Tax=Guptibacillus hwajinpoensis TaxID=208199 RepID=A0A4U1MLF5_9BACL|nr:type III PLP-dependent enzyme [Pseudalkalibacillus hwajinpoensis]TKD72319.1 type III PLP-dependent enzyme [Pseudalkalibacillus hwajinpoensis]